MGTADGSLTPAQAQIGCFDKAVKLFSQQRFEDAAAAFRETAKGPAVHVADRARAYLQVCERRTAVTTLEFRTADDHFNYAVERLNVRDIEKARRHLTEALGMQPDGDHILYALALCCGLAGDGTAAYENLKLAIELEPRNRLHARHDADFADVAESFPAVRSLFHS
jgi:tetratricopeptide (TPR) repeat protein